MAERSQQFEQVNIDPAPRTMVRRLSNVFENTPDDIRDRGMTWYGNVHDAAQQAARDAGKTTRQAAGVVAAVSPQMDWDNHNISAFDEISQLTPEHWAMIHGSAQGPRRSDDVRGMLREVAPSLSRASDRDLLKANRIWNEGVDPEAVLFRGQAPKTNTFFRNINAPHEDNGATVDGRHADLIVDSMRPWTQARNIQSADLVRGGRSRYERYSDATATAARRFGVLPHELQAVDWEMGKAIERNFDPARKRGDQREGQSYQRRLRSFVDGQA